MHFINEVVTKRKKKVSKLPKLYDRCHHYSFIYSEMAELR